jgi:protein-L-isoaspartate(D-aspartate) O-methyltransferase
MLEQLGMAAGHRVLEVGAGTGYNAALLAQLVGPAGRVVTIDLDPEVAELARANLAAAGAATLPDSADAAGPTGAGAGAGGAGAGAGGAGAGGAGAATLPDSADAAGPTGAGAGGVRAAGATGAGATGAGAGGAGAGGAGAGAAEVIVRCGDGAEGFPAGGPYDRVIVTAGAWDLAPAWREQLAPGGRLVVPLSLRGLHRSVALEPAGDGWVSVSMVDCGFMPLRGVLAEPGGPRLVGNQPGLFISVDDDRPLDTDAVYAALADPGELLRTGIEVGRTDPWGGLALWIALHEPDLAHLGALGPAVELGLVPALLTFGTQVMTYGLLSRAGPASLAMLTRLEAGPDAPGVELGVRAFGSAGGDLARQLAAQLHAWDGHGRPATDRVRLRAYPAGDDRTADLPAANLLAGDNRAGRDPGGTATVLAKRHTRLEVTWSTG